MKLTSHWRRIAWLFLMGAFCSGRLFGFGMVAEYGGFVISALAKTKQVPSFFSVLAGNINAKYELKLVAPFGWLNDVCARGAEIEFRINRATKIDEFPDLNAIDLARGVITTQTVGLCSPAISFGIHPWSNRSGENFVAWSKGARRLFEKDFKVRMGVPSLNDSQASGDFITSKTAERMIDNLDGLDIVFYYTNQGSALAFRSLVKKNFIWANQHSGSIGKKIVIFLPGYNDFISGRALSVGETLGEAVRAIKELSAKDISFLCSGAVRYGVLSKQLSSHQEDQDLAELEKWKKSVCLPGK